MKGNPIAKSYHEDIQKSDLPPSTAAHEKHTKEVLAHLQKHITSKQESDLEEPFTKKEVGTAIKKMKTGKAVGMDGIDHRYDCGWQDTI